MNPCILKVHVFIRSNLSPMPPYNSGRIDELIGVYSYQTHIKYLSLNQIARQPQKYSKPWDFGRWRRQNQKLRSCGKPQKSGTAIAT
ncbi:hypothetical protein NPIL_421651 [Nephila pilipes]|uniref:Uncharacterized protein n=1 Tax=Nephila pilipes TaxID=299642 RepID=A0A8X6P8R1_NEPPI|nr:hypothetical protein NPIL_421651 [Nephila pilipes]